MNPALGALILGADPDATEEWKWMGTPIWSHGGIICAGEAYAKVVRSKKKRWRGASNQNARPT